MNGINFCVCSKLAISVLPIVLRWCRKERKKMQVKKESQQNRSLWWFWSRDAAWGILMCLPRLHRKAGWKPDMKVKYLWDRGQRSSQERWDLWRTLAHQATQNEDWREMVFSRVEIWWSVGSRNGETCKWTTSWFVHTAYGQIYCWWRWYGL